MTKVLILPASHGYSTSAFRNYPGFFGEDGGGERYIALQDAGEALLLELGRLAKVDGSRDVSSTVPGAKKHGQMAPHTSV